jgi:hypothetical protein
MQATQAPVEVRHAGVEELLAAHWLGLLQATQAFPRHMGAVALVQSELVTQPTHCPPTTGVPDGAHTLPGHAPYPAWSQPVHTPPTQKARPGSLHSADDWHSSMNTSLAKSMARGASIWDGVTGASGSERVSMPIASMAPTGESGVATIESVAITSVSG